MKFKTLTSEKGFSNVFTGRRSSTAVVAVNEAGEYGFLPEETKPYLPIGGRQALRSVQDILIYKPYNYGK